MSDEDAKGPIGHAVEALVYAPIGLFFEAPTLLPKLVEQGKNHARNARMFGKFAVQHGQAELRRRIAAAEEQAGDVLRAFGVAAGRGGGDGAGAGPSAGPAGGTGTAAANGATTASAAVGDQAAATAAGAAAPVEVAEPSPSVHELAITDYDSLSASQVVTRLAGLSTPELEAVRTYENAHRGRKTILNKIAQLQA